MAQRSPALLVALALLLGCSQQESTPAAPAASSPAASAPAAAPSGAMAQEEAAKVFAQRCTTCHGPQGAGDGPASAGLTPRPRNFQDPAWQKSVTDEHIDQIIQYGGSAVGRSPMMPPNPDLMSKPDVVAALRQHVRGLSK